METTFTQLAGAFHDRSNTILSYHFSVDDVFDSLIEVTDSKIPLFCHPFFATLKHLHFTHGLTVGLYLFFEKMIDGKLRNLTEIRDLRGELEEQGGWIYFGPHAANYDTAPYAQKPSEQIECFDKIYSEIDRFAGRDLYTKWVRLHYYSESFELAEYFATRGVTALLSTDRSVGSHRMPQEVKDTLLDKGVATYLGMKFVRTHFRIEFFANDKTNVIEIGKLLESVLLKYQTAVIYTHECEFTRLEVCESISDTFNALEGLGVSSMTKP
jgi:hypothetical protein